MQEEGDTVCKLCHGTKRLYIRKEVYGYQEGVAKCRDCRGSRVEYVIREFDQLVDLQDGVEPPPTKCERCNGTGKDPDPELVGNGYAWLAIVPCTYCDQDFEVWRKALAIKPEQI